MSARPRIVRKRAFYWVPVYPPEFLGKEPFVKVLTVDPKDLINRVVRIKAVGYVSTYEDQLMDLLFRINKVTSSGAHAAFIGHCYPREVISTIVRRRRSRCEIVTRVITKDNHRVKVSVIAMTSKRAHFNQRRAIRKLMNSYINEKAKEFDAQHFLWNLVIRKAFHREILSLIHKIYPIRDFIVYKSFDESSLTPYAEISARIEGDISKILDKIAEAVRLR
ncbi:MAG: hypothetical protein NDP13_02625 [Crenarchaeota archaeon]|nr:hypothetical protein [Thermoproteota archaeon]MCR8453862.1 hypothetical protein [Thermoproteota archaeon]MCR8455319.1 hypothetical protein [Thermoproteota archaeon]MCR8462589.1 hypothetical protein [Thermoproteota archaeon]MCR8470683.1 hypothetical protein [Thermoproteota archaeon]